jgi:hypothetical protein
MAQTVRGMLQGLRRCFAPREERAFLRHVADREILRDEAFVEGYFASEGIAPSIPVKLRRLLVALFGKEWEKVRPEDNVALICGDLDVRDILIRIDRAFGTHLIEAKVPGELDCTFASFVRAINLQTHAARPNS